MSKYRVQFFTGDYYARQAAANAAKAVCYLEQHFNCDSETATGSETLVATNGSKTSKRWASDTAKAMAKALGIPLRSPETGGVIVGGYGGRGDGNLSHTNMPAILVEPCFVSNPKEAAVVRSEDGQNKIAAVVAQSIKDNFPDGGLVALSIGHKGKTSAPNDRGADVVGGGTEAEYAEKVLNKVKAILEK